MFLKSSVQVILVAIALCSLEATAFARTPTTSDSPIFNFRQSSATIYRGGRPEAEGVTWLKAQGVATIIDLEDVDDVIADEKAATEQAGLKFLSFPMHDWSKPDDNEVAQIEAAINDPAHQPVFVHCHHGENRTGLIMAIHRVESEGWPVEKAKQEMKDDGMSFGARIALLPYFEKRESQR